MTSPLADVRDRRLPRHDPFEAGRDNRTSSQRDRDRILYSSAFRRLTAVTQVAASAEGPHFHNRLTHSLEVAQIARRIAEFYVRKNDESKLLALGLLDPDVVEAAALAHDLGHPPFGHIGETVLNDEVEEATDGEVGFEGNAQSFRIVCQLSQFNPGFGGLNLTRATLNAILKYPWLYSDRPPHKQHKWGAYDSESEEFRFARNAAENPTIVGQAQSLEAAIMDWSDDIAYAVHDMVDFFRAGLIPLELLTARGRRGKEERSQFATGIFARYVHKHQEFPYEQHETAAAVDALFDAMRPSLDRQFNGSPKMRASVLVVSSTLIDRYIREGAELGSSPADPLQFNTRLKREVDILKELTWHYVIEGPHLATQQVGQQRIISDLFRALHPVIRDRRWWVLPEGYRAVVEAAYSKTSNAKIEAARLTADLIAGFTEETAVRLHRRLSGVDSGPLMGLVRWQ